MSSIEKITSAVTMSSLELVEFINSQRNESEAELRHSDFLAKVAKVLGATLSECFRSAYKDTTGRALPCYKFPKREACLMAMSYSYDLQAKVFDRMTELEANSAPAFVIPTTLSGALRLAAEQAETIEEQAKQLALAAPAVQFLDRFVEAKSAKGLREVSKILGAKEREFIAYLLDEKIMFRHGSSLLPFACHQVLGRFEVKTGESNGHAFTQARFTPLGLAWIAEKWAAL